METSRVKKKVVYPYLPVESSFNEGFAKRIIFSDEAHFHLNGFVNKQNCRIWGSENPRVLSHIFEYLPYIDRKNASLVCQHWYNASLDHKFIAKECIYFDHISYLPNKLDILNLFINSARIYHRIVIKDCEINSNAWIELFEKYAPHFHFLCIDRCDINEKMFVQVIEILRELRKLEVHCCNQLLMSGLLFDSHPNISELKLSHCDQLELVSNRYISDHLIHRFFSLTHHIRHISLKNKYSALIPLLQAVLPIPPGDLRPT
ncbi:hypothetical protein M8J77_015430 [Diaphorina citri]|nr:hypothetical protein M8J77_015430 [Diaphorina citri]